MEGNHSEAEGDPLPPVPTSAQEISALKGQWMERVKCPDYSSFYAVENFIQFKLLSVRKQTKIQDYFRLD